jgi:acyl-CoA synthetase (AMP-forming)/AMP-acid ligase II/aryl carrier-like protein
MRDELTSPRTLPEAIEHSAALGTEQPAILALGEIPLSYGALCAQVVETVDFLRRIGLGSRGRVAIVLDNGPLAAVAFCSVASGLSAAPLNPNYQEAEFDFFLGDLEAQAVIVRHDSPSGVRDVARARGIQIVELEPITGDSAGRFQLHGSPSLRAPDTNAIEASDVALLLHTSGTTARPKLVPLTHVNLNASAASVDRTLGLSPADRCLNVMPLFHIHGLVAALLASLMAGGSVVCTPGFFAPQFFDWVAEFDPTWYTAVPTMHQSILARARAEPAAVRPGRLRLVRSSSAPLPPGVMTDLERVLSVPVVEAYGMTEAAHQIASNPLPPGLRKPGSVGVAAGPQIAVMDETGHPLANGEQGEILLRGPSLTAGYAHNPEANRQSFIDGWFRTGDQGYLDSGGYLFITGRLKEQINRGGQKISPREVDEILLMHPAIAQAVTFAIPHPTLGEEVGAAIVLAPGSQLDATQVREFASARIALYKVPSRVLILEAIPKGPTGKVQRIGLAEKLGLMAVRMGSPAGETAKILPRTPLEAQIAQVWRDVLRVEQFGVEDNFIALGGDSILAAQVVGRLRKAIGVDLRLVHFLETPTVTAMAVKILQLQSTRLSQDELERLLREIEGPAPGDTPPTPGRAD